jgi:adenylylsulfate kinase-like enzyme
MVGRAETIPHLNPDMVEALGNPVVVLDGDEIRKKLEQS